MKATKVVKKEAPVVEEIKEEIKEQLPIVPKSMVTMFQNIDNEVLRMNEEWKKIQTRYKLDIDKLLETRRTALGAFIIGAGIDEAGYNFSLDKDYQLVKTKLPAEEELQKVEEVEEA